MRSESLGNQLQRIGGIAAVALVLAAGLATFALLKRIVPPPTPTPTPRTLSTPSTPIVTPATPSAATAGATSGGQDPIAASQRQFLKAQTRQQQQAAVIARRQRIAQARWLAAHAGKTTTTRISGPSGIAVGRSTSPSGGTGSASGTSGSSSSTGAPSAHTTPKNPTGGVPAFTPGKTSTTGANGHK